MSAIDEKYQDLGGSSSELGEPSGAETDCGDGEGRFRIYDNGAIYWHPNVGAFEVHGPIYVRYMLEGSCHGPLGYPVTDQKSAADGQGRYNDFQHGSITHHPDVHAGTGALPVLGDFWPKWNDLGREQSFLGYPITEPGHFIDENCDVVHFQNGTILVRDVPRPRGRVRVLKLKRRQGAMPCTIDEANDERRWRRNNLVAAWARSFIDPGRDEDGHPMPHLPGWTTRGPAQTAVRRIAAVLYVLGNRPEFSHPMYDDLVRDLNHKVRELAERARQEGTYDGPLHPATAYPLALFQECIAEPYFRTEVSVWYNGHKRVVGTPERGGEDWGDWDMVLIELAAFLYAFRDRKDLTGRRLLTKDMVYFALWQHNDSQLAPFTFSTPDEKPYKRNYMQKRIIHKSGIEVWMPETENHALSIYTWSFLISNWIMWQGTLPPGDDWRDKRVVQLYVNHKVSNWLKTDYVDWLDRVLQIVGRVVHNGLFETNARPYQQHSLTVLWMLATWADALPLPSFSSEDGMPDLQRGQKKVVTGARNAAYYIAARFAFQSFQGKRCPPMRRENGREQSAAFYQHDQVPDILGALTGAYVFDDGIEPGTAQKYRYDKIGRYGGRALWAAFTDSDIPHAIHDFMLNKHGGYFARAQARYFKEHYPLQGRNRVPQYFDSAGRPFEGNKFEGTPEFYFCTDDYLLSAGGRYSEFYHWSDLSWWQQIMIALFASKEERQETIKELKNYHLWSKPTMVITRGDIGGWEWMSGENSVDVDRMQEDVLLMLGERLDFAGSNNISVYKSFAYGYERHPPGDREWPQRFPTGGSDDWQMHLYVPQGQPAPEFHIGDATFRVFDFATVAEHALCGHFLIMAKLDGSDAGSSDYLRGFIEIVPGWMYGHDAHRLASSVISMNEQEGSFDLAAGHGECQYVMATTQERLTLDAGVGPGRSGHRVLAIHRLNEHGQYVEVPLDEMLLPGGLSKDVPLLTVWGIGRVWGLEDVPEFEDAAVCFAETPTSGRLIIRNPYIQDSDDPLTAPCIEIDSRDYANPQFRACPFFETIGDQRTQEQHG